MNKTHLLPTFVIALIGIAGVLLILSLIHI